MRIKLKTKIAKWLVKCAKHIDPNSQPYSPDSNVTECIHLSMQTKSVEKICAQINYSHIFSDCPIEQFEKNYVLPEIADKIAEGLLSQGYIEVERTDDTHGCQWNATLYVVKL